jgi:hypothetical protein
MLFVGIAIGALVGVTIGGILGYWILVCCVASDALNETGPPPSRWFGWVIVTLALVGTAGGILVVAPRCQPSDPRATSTRRGFDLGGVPLEGCPAEKKSQGFWVFREDKIPERSTRPAEERRAIAF